jgi:L-threonylcarbamoyladenylate synthase
MSETSSVKEVFEQGGIIAYPTEAMFGLGCDPDNEEALQKLIDLKGRDAEKGFILVASDYSQLLPYINDKAISQDNRFTVLSKWPGQVTWLIPKADSVPPLLTGKFDTVATRVPDMDELRKLCRHLGKPIVSTSANFSGQQPAKTSQQVVKTFGDKVDYVVDGTIAGATSPSKIFDARTGQRLR